MEKVTLGSIRFSLIQSDPRSLESASTTRNQFGGTCDYFNKYCFLSAID